MKYRNVEPTTTRDYAHSNSMSPLFRDLVGGVLLMLAIVLNIYLTMSLPL